MIQVLRYSSTDWVSHAQYPYKIQTILLNLSSLIEKQVKPKKNYSKKKVDGFIGVKRRRNRIKKFFLSGIDERVKEAQILSYLEQQI